MSTDALVIRYAQSRTISYSPSAFAIRDAALEQSSLVSVVRNADENQRAIDAMAKLKALEKQVEEARQECKKEPWQECLRIDEAARKFIEEVKAEMMRVARALGDFETLQQNRRRAEEAAQKAQLLEQERAKARELAQADSHEKAEAVQEKYERIAAAMPAPSAPVRATGQVSKMEWEITVTDVHALYRSHPNCVKLDPLMGQIKAVLDAEGKCAGVKAERVAKVGVRLPKERVLELSQ